MERKTKEIYIIKKIHWILKRVFVCLRLKWNTTCKIAKQTKITYSLRKNGRISLFQHFLKFLICCRSASWEAQKMRLILWSSSIWAHFFIHFSFFFFCNFWTTEVTFFLLSFKRTQPEMLNHLWRIIRFNVTFGTLSPGTKSTYTF